MSKKKNSKEELEKAYFKLQILEQEAKNVENNIRELERKRMELEVVSSSLDEIKNQKGNRALIPVGSGIFMEGRIDNKNEVIMNIGANVMLKKKLVDAKKIIQEQIKEIGLLDEKLKTELSMILKEMNALRPVLENV